MKYRRRPVVRETVDAIRSAVEGYYLIVRDGSGDIEKIAAADFERDYEPVKRERKAAVRKTRKKVDGEKKTDMP